MIAVYPDLNIDGLGLFGWFTVYQLAIHKIILYKDVLDEIPQYNSHVNN